MKNDPTRDDSATLSGLPLDPQGKLGMRVSQAQLARIMCVSRQTVSDWVKTGKVSTYPDGTIDPRKAMREYTQNTDPARMRARVLRDTADELQTTKQALATAEQELCRLRTGLRLALDELVEARSWFDALVAAVTSQERALRNTDGSDAWAVVVEQLVDEAAAAPHDPDTVLADCDGSPLLHLFHELTQAKTGQEPALSVTDSAAWAEAVDQPFDEAATAPTCPNVVPGEVERRGGR